MSTLSINSGLGFDLDKKSKYLLYIKIEVAKQDIISRTPNVPYARNSYTSPY